MFEIGSALREARERRGLTLAQAERDTRIRARWLRALEQEHFDLLPERVYAVGFLRTYAGYLGLDAQRFVDELSSRLPPEGERHEPLLTPVPLRRRRELEPWLLGAIGLAAVVVIVIGLIGLGGSKKHTATSTPSTTQASPPVAHTTTTAAATPKPKPKPKALARVASLVLVASRGRCWLDARLGSPTGRELHSGTLEVGQSLRLSGRRIWIRLGAPTQLDATLEGKRVQLPATTPVNLVVTASGAHPVP